ncbi:Fe-S cluster assembly protein SufB, partial [Candidatus Saccharibacteria bacterium]|nr:Fe-S cluster assembly protein SufB [Candidatus Saccharibacteria bacterium]
EPKKEMVGSWDEVPAEIRETFEQLGIPEAEREHLAGVGAQYDSEVIYHNLKEQIAKKGVVYLPMEEAVATTQKPREEVISQYGVDVAEILKKHFMKLISESDHKFAALHAAAWSGGSFIYVPKGVTAELPIQSYYRMNEPGIGQFEHTLIVVDEGSELHFIEGCSAPKYEKNNLHVGSVEIFVKKGAKMRFSTVESWSKNVFNLNTKRALVETGGEMEWVSGTFGSKVTMLYPTTILKGEGAKMEYLGMSLASGEQILDSGAKAICLADNTSAIIRSKSVSKNGGVSMTKTLAKVGKGIKGVKAYIDCKSLILDSESRSYAEPMVDVNSGEAEVTHEASVGKLSEEILYYLATRGIDEEKAKEILIRGFSEEITKALPLEYAMEMNNLIKLEMQNM